MLSPNYAAKEMFCRECYVLEDLWDPSTWMTGFLTICFTTARRSAGAIDMTFLFKTQIFFWPQANMGQVGLACPKASQVLYQGSKVMKRYVQYD